MPDIIKYITTKKVRWMVRAWLNKRGEAACCIYRGRLNSLFGQEDQKYWTFDPVPQEQLPFVPASVVKANAAAMEKIKEAA